MGRDRETNRPRSAEPDVEAIPVREDEPDVVQRTRVNVGRDRIRWGPIWAGLLTALATFLLLSLLALAIGAQTVDAGDDVGTVVTTTGWATAVIGLIAFFLGGYVAGLTSTV
jgi:hypothetical protein